MSDIATPLAEPQSPVMPRRGRSGMRIAQRIQQLNVDHPLRRLAGRLRLLGARQRTRRAMALAEAAETRDATFRALDAAAFDTRRNTIAQALRRGHIEGEPLVEGLALVREAVRRTLGVTPYREQLAAAVALISGDVIEMATGEGKTIAAALPAALHALAGRFVHVVTSNDYLAERDARQLQPLHEMLGLTCSHVVNGMETDLRRAAYRCDIVHVSSKELVFDFLRDRLMTPGDSGGRDATRKARLALGLTQAGAEPIQRGLDVCIVDEIDSVLIDEAGTPLIISANADATITPELAEEALDMARQMQSDLHFARLGDTIGISFTQQGMDLIETLSARAQSADWRQRVRREELARAAVTALHVLRRDRHYIVRDGKVIIVDENTGRTMPDRFWGDALHPLVEHIEGCPISPLRRSLAAISFQRFFLRYPLLSGMSGTVAEVAPELSTVFGMPLTSIPRRKPLLRRMSRPHVYATRDELWAAAAEAARVLRARGQPVLIGVGSVREAQRASAALDARAIPHQVLSAAQDEAEAEAVAQAGQPGIVTVATNMAGRGTDIQLGAGVAEVGGLSVLLCERHASRRVDRQLIGRSARQGEPGLGMEFLSRDDSLFDNLPKMLIAPARRLCRMKVIGPLLFTAAQNAGERDARQRRYDLVRRDEKVGRMLGYVGGLD